MLNYRILFVLLSIIQALNSKENSFVIKSISEFPVQPETRFEITISLNKEYKLNPFDTMIIRVTDPIGSDQELASFEFGIKDFIEQEFIGEYFRISIWGKNEEKRVIFTVINFTKLAHNKFLEIFVLNPLTKNDKKIMLSNLKLANNIYKSRIILLIPSEIELQVNSRTVNEIGVRKDSVVEVTCRAYNGFPKMKPNFSNNLTLKELSTFFNDDLNIVQSKFNVSILDHGKNLTCKAGNETKDIKINVFHNPTNVEFQPEVNKTVGNNTGIICTAANGYPIPIIKWHFIEGPSNSSAYYQISSYNQRLFIKPNAPIGSKWKFNCSTVNSILDNSEQFNKTISFRITNQKKNSTEVKNKFSFTDYFDNNQNNDTQIEKVYNKVKDLEVNIRLGNTKMSLLKDTIYEQKLQIFQLRHGINKLKEKQAETNEEIVSIKKIVNSEIKSLKNELEKIKGGKNILEKPKSVTQKSIILPIATFDWKIERISYLRRKRKNLRGRKLYHKYLRFPIKLTLYFSDFEYFRINVLMSPIYDADSSMFIKGYVTITLINSVNTQFQKNKKLYFERNRQYASVDFNFKFLDLYQNHILQNDDVIIRCSFTIL